MPQRSKVFEALYKVKYSMTFLSRLHAQGQNRSWSETAHFGALYQSLSFQVLSRIRDLCLQKLTGPLTASFPTDGPIQIRFSSEQIQSCFLDAQAEVLNQTDNRSLVEKVSQVFKNYMEGKESVTLQPEDLEALDGGKGEAKRMERWMMKAQIRTLLSMERERGTKEVLVSTEKREICCYRYALEEVGCQVPTALTKTILLRILEQRFDIVSQPEEGDVVLFCQGASPTHLGVIREGKVLSKEGDRSPIAYIRPLEDLPPEYGDRIVYFRQRQGSLLKRRFDELDS